MPQLPVSLLVEASQPLAARPSQSPKLGLQLKPQVLAAHFALATLAPVDGQACWHVPQLLTSIAGMDSQPLAARPSQSLKLALQTQARAALHDSFAAHSDVRRHSPTTHAPSSQ